MFSQRANLTQAQRAHLSEVGRHSVAAHSCFLNARIYPRWGGTPWPRTHVFSTSTSIRGGAATECRLLMFSQRAHLSEVGRHSVAAHSCFLNEHIYPRWGGHGVPPTHVFSTRAFIRGGAALRGRTLMFSQRAHLSEVGRPRSAAYSCFLN